MSARIRWSAWAGAAVAAACLVVPVARGAGAPVPDATYAEECGACHVAYPARLLTRPQWGEILGRLDRHFGVDASLDAAALRRVAAALGTAPPTSPAPSAAGALPRITAQPWFQREHSPRRLARHAKATNTKLSQCDSCHAGATRGRFEEEDEE